LKEQKPLEEWMLDKGFTQRSLARAADVSPGIINMVIGGERTSIRSDTRGKIAKALGIEIRQVIEFDNMIKVQLGKDDRLNPIKDQPVFTAG
jgi:transcriptional regulator with XRE-family HTH domain